MPDPPFSNLLRIIDILQNSILLEYCSILQNKHLAYIVFQSKLHFKKVQELRLGLVCIPFVKRRFEVM